MNGVLVIFALVLVAVTGTVTAFTQDPGRQAVMLSVHGLVLGVLFFVLQAPDVALSQVAVGAAVVPLMVMLTLRTVREWR
jgi:energy-converting hydrogenase B subunit D